MPKVTVVTPNYNYARYLPQRLDSILAQTYQDFELIILDNASTDNSREVIESYAKDPRVKMIFNAKNNGSTFKQWNLGLSHARGRYIWFAESDDYAEPSLLETLVDRLDRYPKVGIAFSQSWAVDENSQVLYNCISLPDYYDSPKSHWRADYVNSGRDECAKYLYWQNTIPNASAALLRRKTLDRAGGVPDDFLLCGDWMTYAKMLSISDIAFVSSPLNFFRQHPDSNRIRQSKEIVAREIERVRRLLLNRCGLPAQVLDDRNWLYLFVHKYIHCERRPPYNKVPPVRTLGLLLWFARLHPRAFKIALPTLSWELMADIARRVGILGLARKRQNALAAKGHESADDN
jgi:glycosyltransferase involved in cell wall biosynthesis